MPQLQVFVACLSNSGQITGHSQNYESVYYLQNITSIYETVPQMGTESEIIVQYLKL